MCSSLSVLLFLFHVYNILSRSALSQYLSPKLLSWIRNCNDDFSPGNSLVIIVILRHRRMRTITNFFLANLAVADLCVGVFCLLPNLSQYLSPYWLLGKVSRFNLVRQTNIILWKSNTQTQHTHRTGTNILRYATFVHLLSNVEEPFPVGDQISPRDWVTWGKRTCARLEAASMEFEPSTSNPLSHLAP